MVDHKDAKQITPRTFSKSGGKNNLNNKKKVRYFNS